MKTRIKYTLTAPLSHIGETASTGSYFQTIQTAFGRVPVVTANSVRGQLRDSLALRLLTTIGARVDKEVFHVLFSGGNISGTMRDDIARSRAVREHFPMISLLGGGLGTMIMAGKLLAGFAYPVCDETQPITGEPVSGVSWHTLIDEIEFTRMDDSKQDGKAAWIEGETESKKKDGQASTQMRYSVQYIAAGTEFVQDFHMLEGITDLELGAFYAGLETWFEVPRLGGMAAKGFGFFDAVVGDRDLMVRGGEVRATPHVRELIDVYDSHVRAEGAEYLDLLRGAVKNGKAGDKTD